MSNGINLTTSRMPPLNGFSGLSAVSPNLLRIGKGIFEVALAKHLQESMDDAPWWVNIGVAVLFADGLFSAGGGILDVVKSSATAPSTTPYVQQPE